MPLSEPDVQLNVLADFDPQLPARVLGRFATLNELPPHFALTRLGDDTLRLTLAFRGDPEQARRLALKLETLPSVRRVDLSMCLRRAVAR